MHFCGRAHLYAVAAAAQTADARCGAAPAAPEAWAAMAALLGAAGGLALSVDVAMEGANPAGPRNLKN